MSNLKTAINLSLYRTIKNGDRYNDMFPKSECKAVYSGSGDTFLSIKLIKEMILEYYKQTNKIAKKLKGNSTQETTKNVYRFLYDHLQYTADNADQLLRSPACSWHARKEGIDCKSYSIFAGAILKSLGIKFYVRKIKQPGMAPDQFTHVYIIVPKNQQNANLKHGYYVIDPTTHNNKEAMYIEKNDVFMDHFALNAPATTFAQGQENRPIGVTETLHQKAVEGFTNFIKWLADIGICPAVLNELKTDFRNHLSNGINPTFGITPNGVVMAGKLYPYMPQKDRPIKSPMAVAYSYSQAEAPFKRSFGLNGSDEVGDEIVNIAEDYFTDSNWFNSTIGNIFANGFDLSCWGSSYSPKEGKSDANVDLPFILKYSGLTNRINTQNLNKYMNIMYAYIADAINGQDPKYAKCSRKGHELRQDVSEAAVQGILNEIRNLGYQVDFQKMVPGDAFIPKPGLPGHKDGRDFQWKDGYATPTYIVTNKGGHNGGVSTGGGGSQNTGGGSGSQNTGNNKPSNNTKPSQGGSYSHGQQNQSSGNTYAKGGGGKVRVNEAGMNPIIAIGLILGGLYLYNKNKKKVSKNA